MDEHAMQELRTLRGRAYGPGGDIHRDPDALERLRTLEDLHRSGATAPAAPTAAAAHAGAGPRAVDGLPTRPAHGVPAPSAPVERDAMAELLEPAGAPNDAPTEPATDPSDAGPRMPRRVVLWWALSLVVAVVVAVVATEMLAPRVPGASDARIVAEMPEDPAAAWPDFLGPQGEETRGFGVFSGMSVFVAKSSWWGSTQDSECLIVVPGLSTDANGQGTTSEGPAMWECDAGAFPATVQVNVSGEQLPPELLERFPQGSGVQFVLDGDKVLVVSDAG